MISRNDENPEKKGCETASSTRPVEVREKQRDDQMPIIFRTDWPLDLTTVNTQVNQGSKINISSKFEIQVIPVLNETMDEMKRCVSEAISAVKNSPGGWPQESVIIVDIKPEVEQKVVNAIDFKGEKND